MTHCGLCHAPAVAGCRRPFSSELVLCEGGGPGHLAPAVWIVTYIVTTPHGDEVSMAGLSCDHASHVGRVENHAHSEGERVERRPLTREDAEAVSGLDLGSAVAS